MPFLSLCFLLFFAGIGALAVVLLVLLFGGLGYLEWKEGRDWRRADRFARELKAKHPTAQLTPGPLRFVPPAREMVGLSQAMSDVLAERERQVSREGWTKEHDDTEHRHGELAIAAACYALTDDHMDFHNPRLSEVDSDKVPTLWPWHEDWWKRKDRRRDLVRAGALLIAEIERLDRVKATEHSPCN